MALTPAQKQARYRDRLKEKTQMSPEAIEAALLAEVEQAKRGEPSDQERAALADQLDDIAMDYLRRSQRLAKIAQKLRPPGWNPPDFPK
jgi:hypothetical protein